MINAAFANPIPVGLLMIANSVTSPREKAMIARWKKEFESHNLRHGRPQQILTAIGDGYDTLAEIVAETGIPQTTVLRHIETMIEKKRIRDVRKKNLNHRTERRFEII